MCIECRSLVSGDVQTSGSKVPKKEKEKRPVKKRKRLGEVVLQCASTWVGGERVRRRGNGAEIDGIHPLAFIKRRRKSLQELSSIMAGQNIFVVQDKVQRRRELCLAFMGGRHGSNSVAHGNHWAWAHTPGIGCWNGKCISSFFFIIRGDGPIGESEKRSL